MVGNHYEEQVLLIKASWGGRALARGFLPPSSMLSDKEYIKLTIRFISLDTRLTGVKGEVIKDILV